MLGETAQKAVWVWPTPWDPAQCTECAVVRFFSVRCTIMTFLAKLFTVQVYGQYVNFGWVIPVTDWCLLAPVAVVNLKGAAQTLFTCWISVKLGGGRHLTTALSQFENNTDQCEGAGPHRLFAHSCVRHYLELYWFDLTKWCSLCCIPAFKMTLIGLLQLITRWRVW